MDWRGLPKIDAHIHIIPQEVHNANPGAYDEFSFAKEKEHLRLMETFHIERAMIMTFNDPFLMSMGFTVDAVHRNLAKLCAGHPGRYFAAADIDVRNAPETTCEAIERAFSDPCFKCVKIHPNNAGMNVDDAYNDAVAELAMKLGVPVAVHSYPAGKPGTDRSDFCAPVRIKAWMERHPGLRVVVCHLGGFQWEDAAALDAYFDISAILPDLADQYGVAETERILRRFGTERLLFGTDWPCSRSQPPADIYDRYFGLLDRMEFSPSEARQIAYENAVRVFGLPPIN